MQPSPCFSTPRVLLIFIFIFGALLTTSIQTNHLRMDAEPWMWWMDLQLGWGITIEHQYTDSKIQIQIRTLLETHISLSMQPPEEKATSIKKSDHVMPLIFRQSHIFWPCPAKLLLTSAHNKTSRAKFGGERLHKAGSAVYVRIVVEKR